MLDRATRLCLPMDPLAPRRGPLPRPFPNVHGCLPSRGSSGRDLFLVHFSELPRGKCLFFSASQRTTSAQQAPCWRGGRRASAVAPAFPAGSVDPVHPTGLASGAPPMDPGQLTALTPPLPANGRKDCSLRIKYSFSKKK